ncbi:Gfo/Idh/MocA family protein [Methanoplanus endosymbiosus]|uniref:Gfo/Idh/MocA family oxidoreductase n=1 Tax=Methanoplanus endosymbiosus TaxID=33865 RepID=A0A9E7PKI9_9EURY|nr:Gfo/Idh/MocA family oxidoreductase [Methanoplanus endosymbiosus]UUX91804.1 Gfo/Idh/MocA family oxidoreductase [Methanoplanus endosymbiosus]
MDVGVIGAGAMGRNHARVYSELKKVDSLYIYDTDEKAAGEVASKNEGIATSSLDELLGKVDAVSLCVPTPYHFDVAKEIFSADVGTDVLIEKPICHNSEAARELISLIPGHGNSDGDDSICGNYYRNSDNDDCSINDTGNLRGPVVGVGHIERFNPIIKEIKEIIRDPLYVEIKRHNPASARVTGSSVVEDLMIHDIDIVLHSLFGQPDRIEAFGTFDVCSLMMQYDSGHNLQSAQVGGMQSMQGIRGGMQGVHEQDDAYTYPLHNTPVYLSASRKSSRKIRTIHIEEEEFTLQGDFMTQELYIYWKPENYQIEAERYYQENIIEKVMVGKIEPLKTELSLFLECSEKRKPFPVTPEEGLGNLLFAEKVNRVIS